MSKFKLSSSSKENMVGVDRRWHHIVDLALTLTPIDFGIPKSGGLRTTDYQQHLFNQGASLCDGVDKKSAHQSGLALDVYAYVDGKASWKSEHLTVIATAILQAASLLGHPVEWGGLWERFTDMPHFQMRGK